MLEVVKLIVKLDNDVRLAAQGSDAAGLHGKQLSVHSNIADDGLVQDKRSALAGEARAQFDRYVLWSGGISPNRLRADAQYCSRSVSIKLKWQGRALNRFSEEGVAPAHRAPRRH